ncbi:MAG TPA: CoA transferase [Acidimicrobiales bacterium]|jgi:crotonobetainyl-CoA:carnitine CoA-transferase CaiB-like acyl-CoA transferase
MSAACENLTVVDFSQGMAGPMVAMVLADHGADVIKVEPPHGDWARPLPGFQMWNRGKSSVVIDLATGDGRRQARDLVAGADVMVEDLAPGRAAAFGLDYDTLAALNPRLVYCSIAGYDDGGPLAGRKAYDGVVAAAVGRMVDMNALSGAIPDQDRDDPIFTVAPVATYGAAQLALHGVLAALLARVRTGRGQRVDTSLLLGEAAFLMRQDMARGGEDRTGLPLTDPALHRGIVMCFLTAECSDGRYIQMCARQDHHFRNWMRVLEMEDIFDDPRYARAPLYIATVAEVVALEDRIRERMRKRSQSEWMQIFIDGDVGADPFLLPEEFLRHPQMVENGRVVEIADPELGTVRQVGPLVAMSDTPARIERPAPALGQHTNEVLTRRAARTAPPPTAPAPAPAPSHVGALAGVTIVELAYYVAGPLSSVLMGELGARVIKVEPLEGDPSRRTGMQNAKFLVGKDSIGIDLKSDEGRQILHQLIGRADALLHNFRPGVPERLGFGWAESQQRNPRLVYLYGASYGSRGPQNRRAAFHSTPNALAGGGIQQAGRGNAPVDDSYPDPGSGLAAATALMLGLWAREFTGRGQYLETTMLTSAGYILSNNLVLYDGAPAMALPDRGQHGFDALYRLYPCRSGWLFVAARRDHEWHALARALGKPEWLSDSRFATVVSRLANDDALAGLIAVALAARSAEEWDGVLTAAGVAAAAASTVAVDKWFEEHGLLLPEDHPVFGPFWRAPPKVRLSANPARIVPPSALGEHTRPILNELGYSDDAVDGLVERGLVVEWRQPVDQMAPR